MSQPLEDIASRRKRMFELIRQDEQATLTHTRLKARNQAADLGFRALALASLNRKPSVSERSDRDPKRTALHLAILKNDRRHKALSPTAGSFGRKEKPPATPTVRRVSKPLRPDR